AGGPQPSLESGDLFDRNPAVFPRERARGVDARDKHFVIGERGIDFGTDEAVIACQREKKSSHHIEERHVVIARYHELWLRQPREVVARRDELPPPGTLSEV